ncbi:MAG: hypothetical protein SW127_20245 [Actinomycetota bacterium]|nr:hypothetical protein [Actinomycetota bacterium]
MVDLTRRSGSQILRTFLPNQTADIKGNIYKVSDWSSPAPLRVDEQSVRRSLLREIQPWTKAGEDGGLASDLYGLKPIKVVELEADNGVAVERYPRIWLCPACKRIGRDSTKRCPCGSSRWGQLHFLGFHQCGAVVEPRIQRCPAHDEVMMVSPKSAKAADIRFACPICKTTTMSGLGFMRCPCGNGNITWNVHKARSVYTPRGMAMINPASPEKLQAILGPGGSSRALAWVVEGMSADDPMSMAAMPTREEFINTLMSANGFTRELAESMAAQAEAAGQVGQSPVSAALAELTDAQRDTAGHDAISIATATHDSRTPSTRLEAPSGSDLAAIYASRYPAALKRAGLLEVDLVERFPVLNTMYGYTRGGNGLGEDRLCTFRDKRGGYRLYGDLSETEALLFRLEPVKTARWLERRGHDLGTWDSTSAVSARAAILRAAAIPPPGDQPAVATPGSDLLELLHSYSHRLMRLTSVYAGIDRDSLSEFLLPLHLGFFMYATPKGDFVLGGMQSVFESNLDELVNAFVSAERRCPLDPGCSRGSGACSGCLHVGEPSCRFFNTYLSRQSLFGPSGYLDSL